MQLIKRWASTVSASFESIVSQLENHESLVGAALKEMLQAEARAKVQVNRVAQDGQAMQRRIAELTELEQVWQDRAVNTHSEDKEAALECMRRRAYVKGEREQLTRQLLEQSQMEKQLRQDLQHLHQRIDELKRKKNVLSARESRAQAIKAGQLGDIGIIAEIDDILDRWEIRIGENEGYRPTVDTFEAGFKSEEERIALQMALDELLASQNTNSGT